MKLKPVKIEVLNHGYDHAQYFPGCGTTFTEFDVAVTGAGSNAKEAYDDAVEQAYQIPYIAVNALKRLLPSRPRGIRATDKVPAKFLREEDNEMYWYVSIRIKFKEGE